MELTFFAYSVLRFVPDPVRGERINLGVVVVSDAEGVSRGQFLSGFRQKLTALAPNSKAELVERAVEDFKLRFEPSYRPTLFGERDPRVRSTRQLEALAGTMKNQLQLSTPKPYRAASLDDAVEELFAELVAPAKRAASASKTMAPGRLRELILRTIRDWNENGIEITEAAAEQIQWAHHYADFWISAGPSREMLAALFAIPEDPEERHAAWALRDSVPTIAKIFREVNPRFQAVVVFPPDGHGQASFLAETQAFLGGLDGVIVTRADELAGLRDKIVPTLLPSR